MRKLLIQPQARVDLLEIWHRIAPNNLTAANQVGEQFDEETARDVGEGAHAQRRHHSVSVRRLDFHRGARRTRSPEFPEAIPAMTAPGCLARPIDN
jgi:plasmid stabilization system protein ParE